MQNNVDMMLLITLKNESDGRFLRISSSADILKVQEKLLEMKNQKRLQEHIPLFFYPLGMAMLLILIALSSMSKRRSVSVGIALFLMSWTPYKSEAGLLDFRLLNEAKRAYESGEYEKSERLYAQYQLRHDSPQVRYNRANALYMSGQFERSRYWYERVYTSDPILSERVSHNLEQSEIQIKRAELQKNKQETSATKEATPSHNTPSPSPKKATQTTRLFEW
jgi:Ca-activated chloride channel family protein